MPYIRNSISPSVIAAAGNQWKDAQAKYIAARIDFDVTRFQNRLLEDQKRMAMKLAQAAAKAAMSDYYSQLDQLWKAIKSKDSIH